MQGLLEIFYKGVKKELINPKDMSDNELFEELFSWFDYINSYEPNDLLEEIKQRFYICKNE